MKISAEIRKVANTYNIPIKFLTLEQTEKIKKNIYQKYTQKDKSIFLWESFVDFSMVNDKEGWIQITDFVENEKCLMFFDDCEDRSIIEINGGKDLYKLLFEMYGFEFYITNSITEYLICFNHHDCLMGCGTAKKWVTTLQT